MVSRPLPNDRPSRALRTRRGVIYARIETAPETLTKPAQYVYYVTVQDSIGLPEPAISDATTLFKVGSPVRLEPDSGIYKWRIVTPGAGVEEEITVTDELLVDGRVDTGFFTDSNPPAVGWKITGGFGDSFGVAEQASSPYGGIGTFRTEVAFHPSGLAVAIANRDANSHVEVWEWIPGVGFGRKYVSFTKPDVDAFVQNTWDASFTMPQLHKMAWSPSGEHLAIVGDAGSTVDGGIPLVVFRFSLTNGFDWQHPITPSGDWSALADGLSVAWSPDGTYIGVGVTGSPFVKVWAWSGGYFGFGAAIADPASIPDDPVSDLEWGPDGAHIAVAVLNNTGFGPSLIAWPWSAGFGAVLANPADNLLGECQSVAWHPDGTHVIVTQVDSSNNIYVYEFTAGAWGARIAIEAPVSFVSVAYGANWNPSGSLIAAIGHASGIPSAKLWTWGGGVATALDTTTWSSVEPDPNAALAWRPTLTA